MVSGESPRMFIHVGYGNHVVAQNIISVFHYDSKPIKEMVKNLRIEHKVTDLCKGNKTRSAILMNNGWVILSSVNPKTIVGRSTGSSSNDTEEDEDDG